ncbi:LysR family transcriptional regulator [Pseudomonas fulva]|uniref:LysR family transcriptional regulator n=1 Tax=Pseudomonas fulva TaxID=47880 RepID=UPI0018AA6BFA|nr:LysR family transcriptional regulator [Pseudomonas fulva]MBF8677356.1 LysR family transcriptional regulator [Pseudomonas fulva]MBF8716091.1 LysR family transcriptional regulator [Pseudomonas fulva]MBF8782761.1 LysR family transcriptional regulator [Pseudomonas fulva]
MEPNQLGTSPQKVTRAVQEFERLMGEPLFHRSTRQMRITDFGKGLAHHARAAVDSFDQIFMRADHGADQEVVGRVGLTAPHAIGKLYLARFLAQLRRAHPKLSIDLSLDDELTDSVASRIDIGIRVGTVRDRRFIARTVASVPLKVVAAPELIASMGSPSTLSELKAMPLSLHQDRKSGRGWPWIFPNEDSFIPEQPGFTCDDPETELEMVLEGAVFAQIPSYLAEPHLTQGTLVEVLQEAAPQPLDLVVYRTRPGPASHRIKVVYDFLLEKLSDPSLFPGGAPAYAGRR